MLEEGSFRNRSADFVMMFLFGGALMLVSWLISFCPTTTDPKSVLLLSVVRNVRQPVVPGAGVHDNAGVRVVPSESTDPHELLRYL